MVRCIKKSLKNNHTTIFSLVNLSIHILQSQKNLTIHSNNICMSSKAIHRWTKKSNTKSSNHGHVTKPARRWPEIPPALAPAWTPPHWWRQRPLYDLPVDGPPPGPLTHSRWSVLATPEWARVVRWRARTHRLSPRQCRSIVPVYPVTGNGHLGLIPAAFSSGCIWVSLTLHFVTE